jgi:hypothetical protein
MDPTDPIRRVSAVSTGQVQIRLDHLAPLRSCHDLFGDGSRRLAQAAGRVPTLTTA